MGFGDLRSADGLNALSQFLADRSYIEGYTPSQADVVVYKALGGAPSADLFNVCRWFNQIKSYTSTFDSLPGVKKPVTEYGPSGTAATKAAPAADDDDSDDDFDCFASDDESTPAPPPKKVEAKVTKPKKVVIAKSSILFDVKPCDDETDLGDIEKKVRGIVKDGLTWGASKRVPLCYGIEKLSILSTVEDDKVGVDDLQEEIEEFEEVQSVDIAAFNKI